MQEKEEEEESNTIGLWLGWIMAAIYMGGRLPQILLNVSSQKQEKEKPRFKEKKYMYPIFNIFNGCFFSLYQIKRESVEVCMQINTLF